MDVLVAGGHGQIGLRLLRLLAAGGHNARGLVRNEAYVADLEAVGAHAVLCDLETDEVTPHVGGADAIVFAAGAGPGSGDARKRTVDYGAAVKCVEAAQQAGVSRFVIVSSMGIEDAERSGTMRPYFEAKREADDAVINSGLDWTVVRPGRLTNDPGTGTVEIARTLGALRDIPRDDVALVLFNVLSADNTIGTIFEVLSGPTPVEEAVAGVQPR
jgi:uncharacterized protein YbjT (DUF2867 family)